jgi:hypothetical protein
MESGNIVFCNDRRDVFIIAVYGAFAYPFGKVSLVLATFRNFSRFSGNLIRPKRSMLETQSHPPVAGRDSAEA